MKKLLLMVALPILISVAISWTLYGLGVISYEMTLLLQSFGTSLVLAIVFIWIVNVDSLKRWPNTTTFTQMKHLITFSRK